MSEQSNLERYRAERENRESERRTAIVDAAEALFLERGIVDTTMMDIADRAGVSRVTVYRYFSERDHVAYMVAGRMLGQLAAAARAAVPPGAQGLDATRAGLIALVDSFDEHHDAHRFLVMFDNMTLFREPAKQWERWYRSRSIRAALFDDAELFPERYDPDTANRLVTLGNATMGALGRFAMQGELLTREKDINLEAQLENLKDLILGYFDSRIAPHATVVGEDEL